MSDNAQLTAIYAAVSPILAAVYWIFRRRSTAPRIKWLSESIYWFNTRSSLVQAQFEPKRYGI